MWDVGKNTFDSLEDIGFLDFAELWLDEPEMENELISDDANVLRIMPLSY